MSTSILYHAFGLKGIEYKATHFVADRIVFSVEMNRKWVRCPACGCHEVSFKGKRRRWFYMSPIGRKKCILEVMLHRLKCRKCSALWWPTLPFMTGTHRGWPGYSFSGRETRVAQARFFVPGCGAREVGLLIP
ncbi:MAG: hypothetical protein WAW37_01105 [Syntrophobacteraceae bacterium]